MVDVCEQCDVYVGDAVEILAQQWRALAYAEALGKTADQRQATHVQHACDMRATCI